MFGSKAQITIFVIIGLVLFLGAGAYFYLSNSQLEKSLDSVEVPAFEKPFHEIVDSCVRTQVESSTGYVSSTGFFRNSGSLSFSDVPFFYFAKQSKFPSRDDVESSFEDYIIDEVYSCVNNFSSLVPVISEQLVLSKDYLIIDLDISRDSILVTTVIDGKLVSDSSETFFSPVLTSVPSSLGLIYDQAALLIPIGGSVDRNKAQKFAQDNGLNLVATLGSMAGSIEFSINDPSPLDSSFDSLQLNFMVVP